eukprot:1150221-Pelagomonas_calceolata.AAC.1
MELANPNFEALVQHVSKGLKPTAWQPGLREQYHNHHALHGASVSAVQLQVKMQEDCAQVQSGKESVGHLVIAVKGCFLTSMTESQMKGMVECNMLVNYFC